MPAFEGSGFGKEGTAATWSLSSSSYDLGNAGDHRFRSGNCYGHGSDWVGYGKHLNLAARSCRQLRAMKREACPLQAERGRTASNATLGPFHVDAHVAQRGLEAPGRPGQHAGQPARLPRTTRLALAQVAPVGPQLWPLENRAHLLQTRQGRRPLSGTGSRRRAHAACHTRRTSQRAWARPVAAVGPDEGTHGAAPRGAAPCGPGSADAAE